MIGRVEGEVRDEIGVRRVTHETTSGMGIETEHPEESKMMGIPECLKALVPDLVVSRSVHQDHDKQHEVAGNGAGLMVMNIKGQPRADLCPKGQRSAGGTARDNSRVLSTLRKLT